MINEMNEFIRLADSNNMRTNPIKDLVIKNNKKIIGNLSVSVSYGQGNPTNVPWLSITRYKNYKEDGPVFLYYKDLKKLILSFGVKEDTNTLTNDEIDNLYNFKWSQDIKTNYQTVREFFGRQVQRYSGSYVYKSYNVLNGKIVQGDELTNDVVNILSIYNQELLGLDNSQSMSLIDYIKINYDETFIEHAENIQKERLAFINKYPLENILNLTLDDYSQTGNYESFTNYIENKTPTLCSGSLGINQNKLFFPKEGTYKTLGPVDRWYKDFTTITDKFEKFKKEMQEFINNFDIDTYAELRILNFRANIIKFKLIRLYKPDIKLYGLPSRKEINKILEHLNIEYNSRSEDSMLQNIILTKYLINTYPEIKELNTDIVNKLIWDYKIDYIDKAEIIEEPSEENLTEEEKPMIIELSKNLILYGPPGTGKTYNSKIYAVAIIESKPVEMVKKENYSEIQKRYDEYLKNDLISFTTFHQSYGYEEFIEGIHPKINEQGQVIYRTKPGVFKQFCRKNQGIETPRVFIIDEINRGNISKIFGELITLIEPTKRIGEKESMEVILPYSRESFGVPNNIYILGTMNTADRSIALMDTALRRRFSFEEMMPDTDLLKDINVMGVNISEIVETINRRIEVLYDREHTIGHAYFMEKDLSLSKLSQIFRNKIIPLLQEYFYEDYEKIQWVLGDNVKTDEAFMFIRSIKNERTIFKGHVDMNIIPESRYEINLRAFNQIESYKQII